jgi:hypothetical protein
LPAQQPGLEKLGNNPEVLVTAAVGLTVVGGTGGRILDRWIGDEGGYEVRVIWGIAAEGTRVEL